MIPFAQNLTNITGKQDRLRRSTSTGWASREGVAILYPQLLNIGLLKRGKGYLRLRFGVPSNDFSKWICLDRFNHDGCSGASVEFKSASNQAVQF